VDCGVSGSNSELVSCEIRNEVNKSGSKVEQHYRTVGGEKSRRRIHSLLRWKAINSRNYIFQERKEKN